MNLEEAEALVMRVLKEVSGGLAAAHALMEHAHCLCRWNADHVRRCKTRLLPPTWRFHR